MNCVAQEVTVTGRQEVCDAMTEYSESTGDPVYDRLPPQVKREFLQKKLKQEARDKAYSAEVRKKALKGAAIGAGVALVLGLVIGGPTVAYIVVLVLAQAGAAYLIVRYQLGHLAAMTSFTGAPIFVSLLFLTMGLLAVNVAIMLSSWVLYIVAGGILGAWARSVEIDSNLQ